MEPLLALEFQQASKRQLVVLRLEQLVLLEFDQEQQVCQSQ